MDSSASLLRLVVNLINSTGNQTLQNIYQGCAGLYTSSIVYTLFGISFTIWLFLKIKGDFSRADMFKAMVWLVIFILVKVILSSYENYMDSLGVFKIPYYWFSLGVSEFNGGSTDLEVMISTQWRMVKDNSDRIFDLAGWSEMSLWFIGAAYFLVGLVFMIAFVIMTVLSQFMANVILSLGALVFPLVCFSQTRSIFFSWLKLYIGLSLWSPFAVLLSSIPNSVTKYMQQGQILIANSGDLAEVALVGIVLMMFSIFLLTKIPGWVSAIIGSADSSGSGTGLAGAINNGAFIGTRMLAGMGQYAKNRADGQSIKAAATGAMGAMFGGEHGNHAAQGAGRAALKASRAAKGWVSDSANKFRGKDTPHTT